MPLRVLLVADPELTVLVQCSQQDKRTFSEAKELDVTWKKCGRIVEGEKEEQVLKVDVCCGRYLSFHECRLLSRPMCQWLECSRRIL